MERGEEIAVLPDIWSDETVARLNAQQKDRRFHPYTCPGNDPACSNHRDLVATRKGWVCQCGEYRQGWAHGVPAREGE